MNKSIYYILYFLFWLLFCLCSSNYDWDVIHSTFEIDLRAFWDNPGIQDWSYQYCGGVSRYKNLGNHAQSIWFIIPLIFGSFWGVKLFIPIVMTISNYLLVNFFTKRFNIEFKETFLYSIVFSLNGYWILHYYHGHVTYCAQYLFLVAVLYLYDFVFNQVRKSLYVGAISFFGCFSISLYQISTYMLIPTVVSFLLFITYCSLFKKEETFKYLKRFFICVSLCLVPFVLYLHKILAAFTNLSTNKRSFDSIELRTLSDIIYTFFIPAKDATSTFFNIKLSPPWLVHEYSYFSILYMWIIFIIIKALVSRNMRSILKAFDKYIVLILAAFIVSFLFYLGDFATWSPFRILNELVFDGSHRVSQRYLLFGVFAISIFTIVIIAKINIFERYKKYFIATCLIGGSLQVVLLINANDLLLTQNYYLRYLKFQNFNPQMKYLVFAPQKYPRPSYHLILQNLGVLGCNSPVPYKKIYNVNLRGRKIYPMSLFSFISNKDGSDIDQGSMCIKNSYFTQSKIVIDSSCPNELSLYLTNLKENEKIENYNIIRDPRDGLFLKKK